VKTYGTLAYHPAQPRGLWVINADPHVMIRVKRIFGRVQQNRAGAVLVADTADLARDLEWLVDRHPLRMDDATRAHLGRQADRHRHQEQAVLRILTGEQLHHGLQEPARPARPYQQVAADLAIATGRLLLTDDVGLGKSMVGALVLRAPDALPALVVTLTHLPRQWCEEITKTLPSLHSHIATQGTAYDPTTRRGVHRQPDVLVMNYAKLAGWADYLAGVIRTVIYDEAQELRRGDSAKYRAAAQIADGARYRLGLTASPVYNYGIEIYNVLSVLAPDALGTREEFIREWADGSLATSNGAKVAVADPAALGMWLRDQGLMLGRTRKEVGRELPGVLRIPHTVNADTAALDQLSGDAVEMARLILDQTAASTRRWQAAGELDWRLRQATGIAKAPYVAEFVRLLLESEPRLVLFGWHRAVYDLWAEGLAEFNPVFYTGTESPAQKQDATDAFLSGRSRVLVMSLRAGAGLDGLQEVAHVAVFGELDWSPEVHRQCLDAETQVLTRRGFVGADEIDDADEVAAFDRQSGAIHWRPIRSKVDRPLAAGEQMYSVKTPGVDLRVTSGHRMVYRHREGARSRRVSPWKVATAAELAGRTQSYSVPVAGLEEDVPGVPLTDAELEFLGWWVTDGSRSPAARQVTITQAEGSEFNDRIRCCLDACGFAWTVYRRTDDTTYGRRSALLTYVIPKFRSRTRPGRGWAELDPYLDKNLSPLLDAMTAGQLAIFLEAMHMGDGNKQRRQAWTQRTYHIGTARRAMADRLQSLCVRRGWRASLATRRTAAGRDHYTLRVKPAAVRSLAGHGKANLVVSPSVTGERVWCVENELGTLVVRRNGKTAVVGNCIGRLYRDGQDEPVLAYFLVAEDGSDPVIAEVLQIKRGQSEPMLDPAGRLFQEAHGSHERVRLLAAAVLRRHGVEASMHGRSA
jgi:SNF2-related domain